MKRVLLGGVAVGAVLGFSPSASGAATYPQCPAVDHDTGCQILLTVADGGQSVAADPAQPAYDDGGDDALVGIQNGSSKPLSSITLSVPSFDLFGFEGDGLCHPGTGPVPAGCVVPPADGTGTAIPPGGSCTAGTGASCSFPPPPGEGSNFTPANVSGGGLVATFSNGDKTTGYEGPTSWFTAIGLDSRGNHFSGVVNFSAAISPGGSTYVSLENPPTTIVIGAPSTIVSTTLTGGAASGSSIGVSQGTAVTDLATITTSSGVPAVGSVSYTAYSDPACSRAATTAVTAPVGAASPPQVLPIGTYFWQASYGGDAQNAPTTSGCTEVLTVRAPTSVTTMLSGGTIAGPQITVAKGTAVTDVAHIAGPSAATATGSMSYALYKDSACKVLAAAAGTAAVSAGGNAGPSAPQTLPAGTYYWQASYSGDTGNAGSASPCGTEVLAVAFSTHLGLPGSRRCVSRRKFVIHVRLPKDQKAATGTVYINGKFKKNVTFGGRRASVINLRGLPKGRFLVTVFVNAQSGNAYTDQRRYKTCTPRGH